MRLEELVYQPAIRAERGRVTAGLPALSPEQRARLSYQQKQRAKSDRAVRTQKARHDAVTAPDGRRSRTVYDAQRGIELYPHQVIGRLLKLNRNLYFEPAQTDAGILGVYVLDPDPKRGRRFVCGMHSERKMPEFTVVTWKDETKTETVDMVVGWRTVLAKLIRQRLITKAGAEVMFGPPTRDSALWQSLTS